MNMKAFEIMLIMFTLIELFGDSLVSIDSILLKGRDWKKLYAKLIETVESHVWAIK